MNKRTLIAGFIVLAIGIVLYLLSVQYSTVDNPSHLISEFVVGALIVGGLFALAGIILIIYGAILPDPIVHWDNDL
jgi:hypothetical protein